MNCIRSLGCVLKVNTSPLNIRSGFPFLISCIWQPSHGFFRQRSFPFSLIIVNENRSYVTHTYPGFLEEAGYGFEGLYPLLYTLAVDDPYSFYLAAVNTEIYAPVTAANLRGTPQLRQYFHVAALVPYFDEYGIFRIVVFESAGEASFNGFISRYPGHYINLVKVPVVNTFNP